MSPTAVPTASPVLRVAGALTDSRRRALLKKAQEEAATTTVLATGPTGISALEPLGLATVGGETAFLPTPTDATVRDAVGSLEDGEIPGDATYLVTHDSDTATLPVPDTGPLAVGRRQALGPCGWVDPTVAGDVTIHTAERDVDSLADVAVRGRGRGDAVADDPAATAWRRARDTAGDPVVVVNAHEADHRPLGDRILVASAPGTVLDGAAAVARHVEAEDILVYLNEADGRLRRQVQAAVEAFESALPLSVQVVSGPDEYRAGAPTAALEAIEGADRIEPRRQPPPPSEYGLYGRPTVVHTPRTLVQIRWALANPEAVESSAPDPGTRLVTVRGDVAAPATVELPTGASLDEARDAVAVEGRFGMACVGGVFGGFTRDLALPCSASALRAASLGTDGVVELLAEDRCPVAVAGDRTSFAAEANSGRCVPGREGTVQLTELLRDIYDGSFEPAKIRELGRVMAESANCQTGRQAPRPVLTAIDQFEPAFQAHANGRCPNGSCDIHE